MIISNPGSQWEREEPQRTLIATVEALQGQGFVLDDLREVMAVLSLTSMSEEYGPRAVAARLMMLADKFNAEANRLEKAPDASIN